MNDLDVRDPGAETCAKCGRHEPSGRLCSECETAPATALAWHVQRDECRPDLRCVACGAELGTAHDIRCSVLETRVREARAS